MPETAGDLESRAAWSAEVATLRDVVERALAAHPDPRPTLSGAAFAFFAAEVVQGLELEVRRLFGPGIEAPGAARSVGAAVAELRAASVPAVAVAEAGAATGSRRLKALACTLDAYERRLAEAGRWDDADTVRAATAVVRTGGWPAGEIDRLEVRGLYDATALQGELLLALARRARTTRVDIPFEPGDPDATAYAYPYVHLWESLDDPALDVEPRFADAASDGRAAPRVAFRAATDPGDEARRAADLVRRWADAGAPLESIGVVLAAGGRLEALGRELDRRGVSYHARRGAPLVETPLFAALLAPFRLLAEGWPRADLRAWIVSPLVAGLDAEALLGAIDAGPAAGGSLGDWNRALSDVQGESAKRLVVAIREIHALGRKELAPAEFWPAYRSLLAKVGLGAATGDPAGRDAWEDALGDLRDALEAVGRWQGPPVGWRTHRHQLLEAIGERRAAVGRPGRGVEVLTPLDARGLAFRRQVVLGLAQGALARPDPAAAVFGDGERRTLNEALGRRAFRTRADRAREGALLLAERMRETREEIVLAFAVEDEEGRPALPALELERERARRGAPAFEPPTPLPAPAWRREVGAGRVAALQALERDRTLFFGLPGETRSERAGRWDGAFAEERAAALVAGGPGGVARWSASSLETWRTCPHQFFQRYVLRLRPPDERPLEAKPNVVGTLAHRALQILHEEGAAMPPDRERIDDAVERAGRQTRDVERGAPEVWGVVRRQVAATLERYMRHVSEEAPPPDGFRPVAFELGFGTDDAGLPPVDVETAHGGVPLRGQLDRLDRHAGTGRLHVVDYKYSRYSKRHGEAVDEALCGVDRFQLHAYFLGAVLWTERKGLAGPPQTTGAVHCVRQPKVLGPLVAPSVERIREGIAAVVEAALAGPWDPTPRDPDACRYCDFRRTCRIATVPGGAAEEDEE